MAKRNIAVYITKKNLVESPPEADRDAALRLLKNCQHVLTEQDNDLRFDYAKTKKQLTRNFCVNKAFELIKRDAFGEDKKSEVKWKHSEKGGGRSPSMAKSSLIKLFLICRVDSYLRSVTCTSNRKSGGDTRLI